MSKKADPALIGGFVLGAAAVVVIGIIVFGSGRLFTERETFVMFFDGSVQGLNEGAPVKFRGVNVGMVKSISVQANPQDSKFWIPVMVELDPRKFAILGMATDPILADWNTRRKLTKLIEMGLRAQLQLQTLVTGQLFIQLDFYPERPAKLVGLSQEQHEIPTITSGLQELSKTFQEAPIQEISQKLQSLVNGLDRMINGPEFKQFRTSVESTVSNLDHLVQNVDKRLAGLDGEMRDTLAEVRGMVDNINKRVAPLAASFNGAAAAAQAAAQQAEATMQMQGGVPGRLADSLEATMAKARGTLARADEGIEALRQAAQGDSAMAYELRSTLRELSSTARAMRVLVDYIERHPEAFIRGKKAVD